MATMNVSLPEEMKAFVESRAAQEGFGTVSEYLRAVIRDLQKRQAKQELENKLREALLSGPAEPMTRDDWKDIDAKGLSGWQASGPAVSGGIRRRPSVRHDLADIFVLSRAEQRLVRPSLPPRGRSNFQSPRASPGIGATLRARRSPL